MKKNPLLVVLALVGAFAVLFFVAIAGALYTAFGEKVPSISSNSVAVLDVKGVIIDSRPFVKALKKFQDNKEIKAIVIRLDSPGGVVGPSQEMYDEVLKTRQMKKPVIASLGAVAASGAYYIAAACDKIVTNPGTITGSIGVIMEFADLSKLYDWAKVHRYVVKSGEFKDIGSETRTMGPAEKAVIQGMIDNVFMQFKTAVAKGRGLKMDMVSKLADGRIYSGDQAIKNGLADEAGGLEDAILIAARMGGIKGKPEVYYQQPKKKRIWDLLVERGEDDDEAMYNRIINKTLGLELLGKPLYLMPFSHY